METFSKDPFEVVESRIIDSGEGKVMSVTGEFVMFGFTMTRYRNHV